MTLRNLTPEEEAVFDLFIMQRERSLRDDDFFIYDVNLGQETLISNGVATKYGIGPKQQHTIIDGLIKDGILDAELIVEQIAYDSRGAKVAHHPSDLVWKKYGISRMLVNDGYCGDSYFVKMGFDWVKIVNDTCRTKYLCALSLDKDGRHFVVKCTNGKEYVLKEPRWGRKPFEVLKFALNNCGKIITRDMLNRAANTELHIGKKSIKTEIFSKEDNVVKNELSPLIGSLEAESIMVNKTAEMTLVEIEALKKVSF